MFYKNNNLYTSLQNTSMCQPMLPSDQPTSKWTANQPEPFSQWSTNQPDKIAAHLPFIPKYKENKEKLAFIFE